MNGTEHFREAERLVLLAMATDHNRDPLYQPETRATLLAAAQVHATLAQATSASHLLHRVAELGDVMREASGLNDPLDPPPANHPVRFAAPVTGPQPVLGSTGEQPRLLAESEAMAS